jgi:DNA polymerase-3 subunit epsilon
VVIYNAAYDTALIKQTAHLYGILVPSYRVSCAMLYYAAYVGDWNDYRGSYRWPKLMGGDHSAVGDCKATLELIERMAHTETPTLGKWEPGQVLQAHLL